MGENGWRFELWTDGVTNGQWGAYAALLLARKGDCPDSVFEQNIRFATFRPRAQVQTVSGPCKYGFVVAQGRCDCTTSNRPELQAIVEGVKRLTKPVALTVYTDSQYCVKVLSGEWGARSNLDLIEEWKKVSGDLDITFEKVKAHSGVPLNELVHALAQEAMHGA